MKVLLVHNDYGKYSGEEAVVDRMAAMLSGLGHEVAELRMTTAGARESITGKIRGFVSGIYCPSGVKAMRDTLKREKPDVVNVHNLYPFISPAALRECKKAGVPVIMTIHNFRLICPTGLFMRDGRPCEHCLEKDNEWGCVKYNCEQSMLKSVGYAARNAVARINRHYKDCVDYFACITDFQRLKLAQAGFDTKKLILIPNAVEVTNETESPIGDYVGFCGRLSREKGIDMIIEVARRHHEIPFRVAGECREPEQIANLPSNVILMGYMNGQSLIDFYQNSRFMVMASRWYEGFPMAILEAAQHYKPTIGPNHGGFTEIIGNDDNAIGKLFKPNDIDALEQAVVAMWNTPDECQILGSKAHDKLVTNFSFEIVSQLWDKLIYNVVNL